MQGNIYHWLSKYTHRKRRKDRVSTRFNDDDVGVFCASSVTLHYAKILGRKMRWDSAFDLSLL